MIKVILMIVGMVSSTAILGGIVLILTDIFKRIRGDRERRKINRGEREFIDRRAGAR